MDLLQENVDQQKNAVVTVDDQNELSEDALSQLLDDIGEVGSTALLSSTLFILFSRFDSMYLIFF